MVTTDLSEWESFTAQFHDAHILQTAEWGRLKADFGWRLTHALSTTSGAQILIKKILPGINFAYISKGPIGSDFADLWPKIDAVCRKEKCAFLKIEPDLWESNGTNEENRQDILPKTYILSNQCIQPRRSIVVNLEYDDESILARMKQKTRYNINLALKKNVVVQPQTDLSAFYELMKETGGRDQFGIHSLAYYQRAYDLFQSRGRCQLLVAQFEGMPISALIVFTTGKRAWYFYGASSNLHRELMPNYLLQWEAMKWVRTQGCTEYDLWGVPDEDIETLEANFASRNDGLWGVYRFKRGFGGELKRSVGAWDRVYNPFLYRMYTYWIKYRKLES